MEKRASLKELGVCAALFLLALWLRTGGLQRFVTADEAKWVHRSAQFWLAVLDRSWEETLVEPVKPAVTTMWTGGLGLWVHNLTHEQRRFAEVLEAIPEWEIEPEILAAMRLPSGVITSAAIVLIYLVLARLCGDGIALLGAIWLVLDPYFLGHSRFLHHDAVAAVAVVSSLLVAILWSHGEGGWKSLAGSGILAGLAFLTKSTTLILIPWVGLVFALAAWRRGRPRLATLCGFGVWLAVGYLTFVALWPAAWTRPLGVAVSMVSNALRESTQATAIVVLPELGPFYYPVYLLFYITPAVTIGLALWIRGRKALPASARRSTGIIAAFAFLFLVLLTFSAKRGARYALPAFVCAPLLAAAGWHAFLAGARSRTRNAVLVALATVQLLTVIPYGPYYMSYLNPLLGGPLTGPRLLRIGWGEGMDLVGAWLNQQPSPEQLAVGTTYQSTLRPYFAGHIDSVESGQTDYTVVYIKHRYSEGITYYSYYEQLSPAATISLAGVEYAEIYAGPALQIVSEDGPLLAYRLDRKALSAQTGGTLDLIWRSRDEIPEAGPSLSLRQDGSLVPLAASSAGDNLVLESGAVLARYALALSAGEVDPGYYTLVLGDRPLGTCLIEA
jgi:hypothetical protein